MATQYVPYNTAMQLGSGFNSFTQTLCIDHAVIPDKELQLEVKSDEKVYGGVAQSVTYKTSIITKTTDVTNEMNISGAFKIKYDQLKVEGSGQFIDTNKIKESDFSIMLSVKVVNQTIYDHSLVKFQPIPNIKEATPQRLVEVYGDSYISGWQEGGEFLAVISIKAKNREDAQTIIGDAKVAFSRNKNPPPDSDKKELALDLDIKFNKLKKDLAAENEVSTSVTWIGGGQRLKDPEKDWDFDTMKDVALKFPDLCAQTPMRTHALITKYTALRSFYTTQTFDLPVYDKTGTYTNVLQEAYLDYKSILGIIQILAFDFAEGTKTLVVNPRAAKIAETTETADEEAAANEPADKEAAPGTEGESDEGSGVDVTTAAATTTARKPATTVRKPASAIRKPTSNGPKVINVPTPSMDEPFPATIEGLEDARLKCRFMMSRIVQEIDNISIKPEIAIDETRQLPYLSPFLFKMLLPLGIPLPAATSEVGQAVVASQVDPDKLANKYMASVA